MEHKKLRHQAAGHNGSVTDTEEKLLFKPTIPQEIEFYTAIQLRKEKSSSDLPLECWMPTFIGTLSQGVAKVQGDINFTILKDDDVADKPLAPSLNLESLQENREYVVLENLLYGYNMPNIIDIKLGKVLYDDQATEEKRARLQEVSDTTTSGSLGFRICGMKVNNNELVNTLEKDHFEEHEDEYIFINKKYGRSRKPENIVDAFKVYFSNSMLSTSRRAQLVNIFNERLQFFYNTMLEEEVRMYSSSLLLVYEGDPARWDKLGDNDCMFREGFIDSDSEDSTANSDEDTAPLSSMSLIDFAHSKVIKGIGYDENVVEGIEGLLGVFEKLRKIYI